MTSKYNMIDQYDFDGMTPNANGNLIERAVAAIYHEIKTAEYANLSVAKDGSILVDNYKESISIYLVPTSDFKIKAIIKSHDGRTQGKAQQTFDSADSITTDDIRHLIRTAVSRHEDKCYMLVPSARKG